MREEWGSYRTEGKWTVRSREDEMRKAEEDVVGQYESRSQKEGTFRVGSTRPSGVERTSTPHESGTKKQLTVPKSS